MAEGFKYHTTVSLHINILDCLKVVPWYYQNNITAPKRRQPVLEGDDLCMPALWKQQLIVA
jgi:hypothetical protein